jgi:hypothetical protein
MNCKADATESTRSLWVIVVTMVVGAAEESSDFLTAA